jgi:hypothetical protein
MLLQVLPRDGSKPEGQLGDIHASHTTLYCFSTKNLSFGTKSFIFQFAIQEYEDLDILVGTLSPSRSYHPNSWK